jgi:sugar diacid utilization regulator
VVLGFTFAVDAENGGQPPARQLAAAVEQYCVVFEANVSCVSIGSTAYVLFPAVRATDTPLRLAHGAVVAAEMRLGHRVLAAVSSQKHNTDGLPELRREIDEILNVLLDSPGTGVASVKDIHAHMLLTHLALEFKNKPRLRHQGVEKLIAHDEARGTDYGTSLCTYFSAMGDIAHAAGELGVHPNTLRYRLKRAEELFQLRLNRPDDQLAVWLQLRLQRKRT